MMTNPRENCNLNEWRIHSEALMRALLVLLFVTFMGSAIAPVIAEEEATFQADCLSTELCDNELKSALSNEDIELYKGKRPKSSTNKSGAAKSSAPGKKVKNKPPKKTKHTSKVKNTKKIYTRTNYKGITNSSSAMKHIKDTHLNRKVKDKKSQWRNGNMMQSAIKNAKGKPYTIAAKNGYHVRTFDMGRRIGNTQSGRPTSYATVVTNAKGQLVTAYPGHP
ncbi:MAG: hypothetical protein ABJN98_06755 [Roseibium sp.]